MNMTTDQQRSAGLGIRGRWGSIATIVGGVIGIILTLLLSVADFARPGPSDVVVPGWVPSLHHTLGSALAFGPPDDVYQTLGRLYTLAMLCLLPGVLTLRARIGDHAGRLGTFGFRVALLGHLVLLVGLIGDYGIGMALGDGFSFASFGVEMLGTLVVLAGSLVAGIAILRAPAVRYLFPQQLCWLLVAALPVGLLLTIANVIYNLPSGPLFPFCVAWTVLGVTLATIPDAVAETQIGHGPVLARRSGA